MRREMSCMFAVTQKKQKNMNLCVGADGIAGTASLRQDN